MSDQTQATGAAESEPVRWGVLSTANIGLRAVLPAIIAARNSQPVAIASRELAAAERVAADVPGMRAFGSYEALLDDPAIEVVYIPLPNALHAEWTIRAARAGKHVLCEKHPMKTLIQQKHNANAIDRATAATVASGSVPMRKPRT